MNVECYTPSAYCFFFFFSAEQSLCKQKEVFFLSYETMYLITCKKLHKTEANLIPVKTNCS